MLTKIVDMGIVSAIFHYTIEGDKAVIDMLEIGGANAVEFPLTDNWDIDNFSKMLSHEIGLDVVVSSEVA
jgi:hypothetical protein